MTRTYTLLVVLALAACADTESSLESASGAGASSTAITTASSAGGGTSAAACVATQGACIDTIDDATPTDGQALTIDGQDLHQRVTTGWYPFFAEDMTRYDFETADGSSIAGIGYATQGAAGTATSDHAVLGSTSAYFHSFATNPNCVQGIAQSYASFTATGSGIDEGYVGGYFRFHNNLGWPSAYQKWFETALGKFYVQPLMGSSTDPSRWILYSTTGTNDNYEVNGGAPMPMDQWLYFDFHFKHSAPTDFTLRVNGVEVVSLSPSATTPDHPITLFGFINGCGSSTWDVEGWVDGMAMGSEQIHAPAEIWLCDGTTGPDTDNCVWQPPLHITDTQIQVTFTATARGVTIPTGSAWMFVRNQERELSNAYPVTVP